MGKRIGIFLIRCYQKSTRWAPPTCRYTPSCSEYTLQAVERFGLIKGSWLGLKRICRCHPFRVEGTTPFPRKRRLTFPRFQALDNPKWQNRLRKETSPRPC